MVIFFFDTSAVVKRYNRDAGSEVGDKILQFENHELVTYTRNVTFVF